MAPRVPGGVSGHTPSRCTARIPPRGRGGFRRQLATTCVTRAAHQRMPFLVVSPVLLRGVPTLSLHALASRFGCAVASFISSFVTPIIGIIGGKSFEELTFTINGSVFTYGEWPCAHACRTALCTDTRAHTRTHAHTHTHSFSLTHRAGIFLNQLLYFIVSREGPCCCLRGVRGPRAARWRALTPALARLCPNARPHPPLMCPADHRDAHLIPHG